MRVNMFRASALPKILGLLFPNVRPSVTPSIEASLHRDALAPTLIRARDVTLEVGGPSNELLRSVHAVLAPTRLRGLGLRYDTLTEEGE